MTNLPWRAVLSCPAVLAQRRHKSSNARSDVLSAGASAGILFGDATAKRPQLCGVEFLENLNAFGGRSPRPDLSARSFSACSKADWFMCRSATSKRIEATPQAATVLFQAPSDTDSQPMLLAPSVLLKGNGENVGGCPPD